MIEVTIKCDECGKAGTASLSIIRQPVERTVLTAPGGRGSAFQHRRGGLHHHQRHVCPDCLGGPLSVTSPYSVEMDP